MKGFSRIGHFRANFPDSVTRRIVQSLACWMVFVSTITLSFSSGLEGQRARASEYEVKAVYLLNFAKFVAWPADDAKSRAEPFTICILGKNPFGSVLDATIKGETIGGQTVIAKEIANPEEAAGCRVLYIGSSEANRLDAILSDLGKMPILTVSDIPQFSQHGGMIQFVMEGSRVRFEANPAAAQVVGLSMSSTLLKVATNVYRNTRPGD